MVEDAFHTKMLNTIVERRWQKLIDNSGDHAVYWRGRMEQVKREFLYEARLTLIAMYDSGYIVKGGPK